MSTRREQVHLLIVDSISSLITPILGGNVSHGRALMISAGYLLKKLACEHSLAVLDKTKSFEESQNCELTDMSPDELLLGFQVASDNSNSGANLPTRCSLLEYTNELCDTHAEELGDNEVASFILSETHEESRRLGEAIDRTLLKHLLRMFTALGIYSESFEKSFLECTTEFYAAEGVKCLQQSDISDYLKYVEIRLHEESEKCSVYLETRMRKPLIKTVESPAPCTPFTCNSRKCGESFSSSANAAIF